MFVHFQLAQPTLSPATRRLLPAFFSACFVLRRAAAAVVVWDLGKINSFPSQKECNYSSLVCRAVEYMTEMQPAFATGLCG